MRVLVLILATLAMTFTSWGLEVDPKIMIQSVEQGRRITGNFTLTTSANAVAAYAFNWAYNSEGEVETDFKSPATGKWFWVKHYVARSTPWSGRILVPFWLTQIGDRPNGQTVHVVFVPVASSTEAPDFEDGVVVPIMTQRAGADISDISIQEMSYVQEEGMVLKIKNSTDVGMQVRLYGKVIKQRRFRSDILIWESDIGHQVVLYPGQEKRVNLDVALQKGRYRFESQLYWTQPPDRPGREFQVLKFRVKSES